MKTVADEVRDSWIGPDDSRWQEFLESVRHDVYHVPDYVRLCADHEQGEPLAFHVECGDGALFAPMLLREIPPELGAPANWRDSVTPYGYAAPLVTPGMSSVTFSKLIGRFRESARERGLVACFFRLHPILALDDEALATAGELVDHGDTVSMDLRLTESEIQAQMRKSHRYEIRKLTKEGFVVHMDDWSRLSEFAALYLESMERLSASQSLRFPESHFVGLREQCGEHFHFCAITSEAGELACAGLFAETCGIVQFHLAATSQKFRAAAPSKLMLGAVARWAKARDNEIFHLGGGVGNREDALFRFKAGFSKTRHRYSTYRMIIDEARYRELSERWRVSSPDSDPDLQYFPFYRQAG